MNVNIVVAGPEEWDVVARHITRLLTELGDEAADLGKLDENTVRRQWSDHPSILHALLALDGDLIVGVATLIDAFAIYANGSFGIIPGMYVIPSHRARGVGTQLIRAAVTYGINRGWSRLEVTAPESHRWDRTVSFYKSQGFTFAGPKLKLPLPRSKV